MSPGYWLGDRGLERKSGLSLAEPWASSAGYVSRQDPGPGEYGPGSLLTTPGDGPWVRPWPIPGVAYSLSQEVTPMDFLHPTNAEEIANIAGETGAEVLRGPLRYPSETGGW